MERARAARKGCATERGNLAMTSQAYNRARHSMYCNENLGPSLRFRRRLAGWGRFAADHAEVGVSWSLLANAIWLSPRGLGRFAADRVEAGAPFESLSAIIIWLSSDNCRSKTGPRVFGSLLAITIWP